MSLYGALFSGVSGLSAQSSAMGAISDNITNVNTIGYKGTQVNFQTLVTHQVSQTQYSPGGVQSKPRAGIDVQGLLQATNSSTDVALSGQGFFVVNSDNNPAVSNSGQFAYTRAGSFKVDKEGYLQNVSGWYMQGWPLMNWDSNPTAIHQSIGNLDMMKAYKDSSGQVTYINDNVVNPQNLKSMNLNDISGTAAATSSIRMGANLPSGDTVGTTHQTDALMYDSLGNDHNIQMIWTKTGQNAWDVESTPPEGSKVLTLLDSNSNVYSAMGRMDFTAVPSGGAINMTINGNTWNFVAGSGTNGTPANTMYVDPTAVNGSAGTYAANMATAINQAFMTEYSGKTVTPNLTGAGPTFKGAVGSGTNVIQISGTGTTSIDISGLSLTQTIAAINSNSATTGVSAWNNNGNVAYYTSTGTAIAVTATASSAGTDASTMVAAFTGTGTTYCNRVSGTNSVVFRSLDTNATHDITVSGLTSLLSGTAPPSVTPVLTGGGGTTFVAGSTVTVTGPLGAATINIAGMTPTAAAAAISGQVGTTGVGAYWNGTKMSYYGTSAGNITVTGVNDGASIAVPTTAITGTKVLEQAYDPRTTTQNSFTVAHIALTPSTTNAITFNGDGTPSAVVPKTMTIDWANGSQDQTASNTVGFSPPIDLFMGNANVSDGMTQLAGNYQLSYMTQNGAKFGNFSGVSIGSDGIVTALFDNGVTRPVFQIPVATFVNPNGMNSLSGNVFVSTDFSGDATLRTPGTAGAGSTNSSSLEASTVDIGTEFTTMIVTQRAYSAAAKIITTADQMLDELINIKR